jgi:chromosome partitioning protein
MLARLASLSGPACLAGQAGMSTAAVKSWIAALATSCHVASMFIVFGNTKGGVGKSTLAAHLAIWLFDRGQRVALLDTDEQRTSAQWISAAEPGITVATATDVDGIRGARQRLAATHDFLVVDSPGSGGDASHTVTLLADLVVVPLQPSKPDVRAIREALKFVFLARELSGGAKPDARIVLTMTAKGDVQSRRLRQELAGLGVPVAVSEVRRLNAFRDACDGAVTRGVGREAKEAARDLEALFGELLGEVLSRQAAKEVANG